MNQKVQNDSQSKESSVINVNLDDYLRLFNVHNHLDIESSGSKYNPEDSDHHPIGSSTPLNLRVESSSNSSRSIQSEMNSRTVDSMAKYLSTPEHFPSFNIHMNVSNSDISEDESGHQESKTRSGKIY